MTAEESAIDPEVAELVVELERVREENEQFRRDYARARRSAHRRAAIGLAGIGLVALIAAVIFPAERAVLATIGSIGLFGAVLTTYLTPERFVAARVGERVYYEQSASLASLVDMLGLSGHRVYVPLDTADSTGVRLVIPQAKEFTLPDPETLQDVLLVPEGAATRGLSLRPTGARLATELLGSTIPETPVAALDVLADGIVESFELADGIQPTVDPGEGMATVTIVTSHFGPIDRLDHPIPSILACGLAQSLQQPVHLEIVPAEGDTDHCTLSWERTE